MWKLCFEVFHLMPLYFCMVSYPWYWYLCIQSVRPDCASVVELCNRDFEYICHRPCSELSVHSWEMKRVLPGKHCTISTMFPFEGQMLLCCHTKEIKNTFAYESILCMTKEARILSQTSIIRQVKTFCQECESCKLVSIFFFSFDMTEVEILLPTTWPMQSLQHQDI